MSLGARVPGFEWEQSPFSYYITNRVGLYIVTKSQFGWALRFPTLAEHPKGIGNNISIPQGRYINVWSYQVPCELGVTLA
jgi:hypothetical protein